MFSVKFFKQLLCFGVVGGVATLLNSFAFIFFVEELRLLPLVSNFLAFALAFWISYFGNSWWTFQSKEHSQKKIMKFLAVSLFGLLINSGFVWLLMHYFNQSAYIAALPMIFVTPIIVFFINKSWVFQIEV